MKVTAKAPGTCGEFIQGILNGKPYLASPPINRYAAATVAPGEGIFKCGLKAQRAAEIFFEKTGIPEDIQKKLDISVASDIPALKGMASSTADLTAVLSALNCYFDKSLTEKDIARICVEVEPSDSLMFKRCVLFDFYKGEDVQDLGAMPEADLLVLLFSGEVDTVDFGYETEFLRDQKRFEKCAASFREAVRTGDLELLGKACTESARINQAALKRDYLEELIALSEEYGGLGVLIGHSGTVAGVLLSGKTDVEMLRNAIRSRFSRRLEDVFYQKIVEGGARIEQTDKP